jgi:hypothetical protein
MLPHREQNYEAKINSRTTSENVGETIQKLFGRFVGYGKTRRVTRRYL